MARLKGVFSGVAPEAYQRDLHGAIKAAQESLDDAKRRMEGASNPARRALAKHSYEFNRELLAALNDELLAASKDPLGGNDPEKRT